MSWPDDPTKYYIGRMFHDFYWGPYDSLDQARIARIRMTILDPLWNYDPDGIVLGDDCPASQRDSSKLRFIPSSVYENDIPASFYENVIDEIIWRRRLPAANRQN